MLDSSNNTDIVKCSHCNTILSSESFESHECNLKLKSSKRIEVIYFQDESYKNKKLMAGWGTDGVLYTFEVALRKPISIIMPLQQTKGNRFYRDEETDGEVPEPENRHPLEL
jgi:hypothetical protein